MVGKGLTTQTSAWLLANQPAAKRETQREELLADFSKVCWKSFIWKQYHGCNV